VLPANIDIVKYCKFTVRFYFSNCAFTPVYRNQLCINNYRD